MAIENSIELALTGLPVSEVVKVLRTQLDYLSEFCTMELDENYLKGTWEEQHRAKLLEGRKRFLSENDLTEFQHETIGVLLDPDAGSEDYSALIATISKKVRVLESIDWEPAKVAGDMVVKPNHYTRFPLEPTQYAMEYSLNWCEGNALKYLCRFPFKNGVEDLKKAMRYVEMLLMFLDGHPRWSK